MGLLFFPNTDFDLQLHRDAVTPKIARAVEEMATLFIPALGHNTHIHSNLTVLPSHRNYLISKGLHAATLTPKTTGFSHYDAWGWLNQAPSNEHPSRTTIEKVNSRQFSFNLRDKLSTALPNSTLLSSRSSIPSWIHSSTEWVAKPLYGNAGAGFLRGVGPLALEESLRENESTSYICEPWLERITDIATRIIIKNDGSITIEGHHRNISNRAGAFYANLCTPNDPEISPWKHTLDTQATTIGTALFEAGYWGVAGIDSFTYEGIHRTELVGGFDINARHTISTLTYGIHKQLGKGQSFLYRFIAKRRLTPLTSYTELEELLGPLSYTPTNREGVLLLSPLTIIRDGQEIIPQRLAFGIIAPSPHRAFDIDEQLRQRVLKKR